MIKSVVEEPSIIYRNERREMVASMQSYATQSECRSIADLKCFVIIYECVVAYAIYATYGNSFWKLSNSADR